MKIYSTIGILILLAAVSNAQDITEYNHLKNDSIVYKLTMVTRSTQTAVKGLTYFVRINMPEKTKKDLLKKGLGFWMDKLNDNTSDWAAEVVLYYLYERDAIAIFVMEKDKSKWVIAKDKEIEYWKDFLTKKENR